MAAPGTKGFANRDPPPCPAPPSAEVEAALVVSGFFSSDPHVFAQAERETTRAGSSRNERYCLRKDHCPPASPEGAPQSVLAPSMIELHFFAVVWMFGHAFAVVSPNAVHMPLEPAFSMHF